MTYRDKLLDRYWQIHNRLCQFYADGDIVITRGDRCYIEIEDCDERELEFVVEHLEDLDFDSEKLMFYEELYDLPVTNMVSIRIYNYVIDVEIEVVGYEIIQETTRNTDSLFKV